MNYWALDKEVAIKGKVFKVCSILSYAGLLNGVRKITITDNEQYLDFIVWQDGEIGRLKISKNFLSNQ